MFNIAKVTHDWALQKGHNSEFFKSLESTNLTAKNNLHDIKNSPKFYFAENQTKGKGRGDKLWSSPQPGEGLLCSMVFKLEKPPQHIAAPCFGWAVYKAFKETFNLNFSVKAPNDIYIEDKKVAGILIESVTQGSEHYLIFGIGVNVFSHPHVDNSSCLMDFFNNQDIEENQWLDFFSSLTAFSSQAAVECQAKDFSVTIQKELEDALYKFQGNKIKSLKKNGSFTLENNEFTHWRDL